MIRPFLCVRFEVVVVTQTRLRKEKNYQGMQTEITKLRN